MEVFSSFHTILKAVAEFGLVGIILVMWWVDVKNIKKILDCYKKDMAEMRQMYKNNVHLVEGYAKLANDLQDVIIMNTQAMTQMGDLINGNQYCPMVRLEKKAGGVQV